MLVPRDDACAAPIRVSVAIPALNEEDYLPRLLRSLCEQRGVQLDVVVVEGSSDDRTVEVTREIARSNTNPDASVRIFTTPIRNVSVQRNLAVRHTRFDALLFLDCDTLLPHRDWLRRVVAKHRYRRLAVSTCRFRPIEPYFAARLNYQFLYLFQQMMRPITPYAMGAMLLTSRELFDRVGGFDERLTVNEDANFVKRVSRHGPFAVLPDFCWVSARRFIRGGFLKTGMMYMRIFLHRTRHGECLDDMGYWDHRHHETAAP